MRFSTFFRIFLFLKPAHFQESDLQSPEQLKLIPLVTFSLFINSLSSQQNMNSWRQARNNIIRQVSLPHTFWKHTTSKSVFMASIRAYFCTYHVGCYMKKKNKSLLLLKTVKTTEEDHGNRGGRLLHCWLVQQGGTCPLLTQAGCWLLAAVLDALPRDSQ